MKNNKKLIFICASLFIIAVIGTLIFFNVKNNNLDLLKKYGWTNAKYHHSDYGVNVDLNNNLDKIIINASKKIGLNPNQYLKNSIDFKTEIYDLGMLGNTQGLYAALWTYKDSIVGAYIYHTEPKIKIKYWSLDTPYTAIVNEIKKDYENISSSVG